MNTQNNIIQNHLYKHRTWLKQVCHKFCSNPEEIEDLISNLTVKLLEMTDEQLVKIKYNGELNNYYIFKIIKSQFLNQDKRTPWTVEITDDLEVEDEPYNYEADESHFDMIQTIQLYWEASGSVENVKLYYQYIQENHSLRTLSEVTGRNKSDLWNSFQSVKQSIQQYHIERKK